MKADMERQTTFFRSLKAKTEQLNPEEHFTSDLLIITF